MKNLFTCLLAALGLTTSCSGQNVESVDHEGFAELIGKADVVLLDVRTAEEFNAGHIAGALNIDQSRADFVDAVVAQVPMDKTIAVYCRSGRRSSSAATRLMPRGYKCVNLSGGIIAWQQAGRAVTTHEVDVFTTPGGKTVKFYALMHASIRIEFDGKEIEIDPVTKLGERTIDYAAMPKADYLLVTHEHADHFDREAIAVLSGEKTRFVTNARCAELHGAGEVMANGDTLRLADDIMVVAVPAYNTTDGHLQFHPRGRDNGYVLTLDGLRIYIAGDTEDIPEMATLGAIDIAFLPCNQPYTMTPDQLLRAARMVKPRVLFPYHYSSTDVTAVPAALRPDSIDVRIRHYE